MASGWKNSARTPNKKSDEQKRAQRRYTAVFISFKQKRTKNRKFRCKKKVEFPHIFPKFFAAVNIFFISSKTEQLRHSLSLRERF